MDNSSHPNGHPQDAVVVAKLTSWSTLGVVSFLIAAFFFWFPIYLKGPSVLLFIPYYIPIAGVFLWASFCLLFNVTWYISVSPLYVTWDRLFLGEPISIALDDIAKVIVDWSDAQLQISILLHSGELRRMNPAITSWIEWKSVVDAITKAAPAVSVEVGSATK